MCMLVFQLLLFAGYAYAHLLCVGTLIRDVPQFEKVVPASMSLKIGMAITGMALVYVLASVRQSSSILAIQRNFYGVLFHGRVLHGLQFLDPAGRRQASTYYSPSSGVGRLLRQPAEASRHIGIVGLGAGTLAVYGRPLDRVRFYEINPDVISLARVHFTFLSDCTSQLAKRSRYSPSGPMRSRAR